MNTNQPARLILASQSPRRRQLLEEAGYEFEIIVASDDAECGRCSGESARDLVARYGRNKAQDVAKQVSPGSDCIVIGCDTVAEIHGQVIGKPRDAEHAEEMLRMFRGREHYVHSGLCLIRCSDGRVDTSVETTKLIMKDITDAEIEEYIESDLWIGKAGGFGLQDRTGWWEIKEGSESNVVGLPMELLKRMFAEITG